MATCGFFAEPWVFKDDKPLPGAVYLDASTGWVKVCLRYDYVTDGVKLQLVPTPETHTVTYYLENKAEIFDVKLHIMPLQLGKCVHVTMNVEATENNTWAEYIMAGQRLFVCVKEADGYNWNMPESQLSFPPPVDDIISVQPMPCDGPIFYTYRDGTSIKLCDPPMCEFKRYNITINKKDVEAAMEYLGYM